MDNRRAIFKREKDFSHNIVYDWIPYNIDKKQFNRHWEILFSIFMLFSSFKYQIEPRICYYERDLKY